MAYIDAARVAGFSRTRIILRHMVPNLVGPYLIMLTAFIAQAILLEATLSFLGLVSTSRRRPGGSCWRATRSISTGRPRG